MAKFGNPLNNLKVASPCSQNWDAMAGDDRRRYCGECKLNVYNLSGMNRTEAQNLLSKSEGPLCVRFYKRSDGSILIQDCPVGWAKVKQRAAIFVTAAASLIFSFLGAVGLTAVYNRSKGLTTKFPIPFTAAPEIIMGAMAVPSPSLKRSPLTAPKQSPKATVGRIVVPQKEK